MENLSCFANVESLAFQLELVNKFRKLLNEKSEFFFISETELPDKNKNIYINFQNNTGEILEGYPIKVNEGGILMIEVDDLRKKHTIEFRDLYEDNDRILLLELMEEKIKG